MGSFVDDRHEGGVKFIHEADGSVTAKDLETGVASFGETKAKALAMLADALTLHEDDAEPIQDEDAFLRDLGIDLNDVEPTRDKPEFLQ